MAEAKEQSAVDGAQCVHISGFGCKDSQCGIGITCANVLQAHYDIESLSEALPLHEEEEVLRDEDIAIVVMTIGIMPQSLSTQKKENSEAVDYNGTRIAKVDNWLKTLQGIGIGIGMQAQHSLPRIDENISFINKLDEQFTRKEKDGDTLGDQHVQTKNGEEASLSCYTADPELLLNLGAWIE